MKLRRLVLFVIGGMTFGASLSVGTIIRSGSVSDDQLIFSGKPLQYTVLKPGRILSSPSRQLKFKKITLAQTQPTVRRSTSVKLLNGRMAVSLPGSKIKALGSMRFEARKAAPQAHKTNAKLHIFAVTPIVPALD